MIHRYTAGLLLAFALSTAKAVPPAAIATQYLGTRVADEVTFELHHQYTDAHNGVTHLFFSQQVNGLDVAEGDIGVHINPAGEVIQATGLIKKYTPAPLRRGQAHSAQEATEHALDFLDIEGRPTRAPEKNVFRHPETGISHITWHLQVEHPDGPQLWDLYVDVDSGEILHAKNLVHHASFRTWDLPNESPGHGMRSTITPMPDPVASPFGWHDNDGVDGPEFTDTRGNNVWVQEDRDANNLLGQRPNGGPNLNFIFPYNPMATPEQNQSAVISHAFYIANLAHDLHYQYGFNEAAGNFQHNNYGRGGSGSDSLTLDVQDGFGYNNASFSPRVDGISPRLQLHIWRRSIIDVQITAPASLAGPVDGKRADFGPVFPANRLTGNLVAALDPPDPPLNSATDGCSALTNAAAITGNIAFIDRGDCTFIDKVRNAQNAGAMAVVVANNVSAPIELMGGIDATIAIPSVFLEQADADAIRAALNNGETVSLSVRETVRDAALETGIIFHEYGHGITTRLTGGPSMEACLDGLQSSGMAEGWSDFWSLAFTHESGDTRFTQRPIGTYVSHQNIDGRGLRTLPYTTDRTVNSLTFANLAFRFSEHEIGEIWCATLWDMYWDLIDRYGYDPDLTHGSGGNNRALQLVMDGLKLQPCNPTFLDARDAILLADQATYNGDHQCLIWRCFARRGMGANALGGADHNSNIITENYDVPLGCEADVTVALAPESLQNIMLNWPSVTGAVYEVQETTHLADAPWITIAGPITAQQATTMHPISDTSATGRHFRVQLQLSP